MIKGGPKIVNDGLVLCLDAHDAKSYAGEPVTNLYGDMSTSAGLRGNRTEYNTGGTWPTDMPMCPEPIGRVYKHTSGALTSSWSGNSYGYMYKDIATTSGLIYTLTFWVYLSPDCDINYMYSSIEGATSNYGSWTGYSNVYDFTKKGTWQLLSKYATADTNVRFLIYPGHTGVTDGSFSGFFAWGGMQVVQADHVTPFVLSSRSATNGWIDRSGNSNSGTLTNMIGTEVSHYRDGQVIMPVDNSYLDFDGSNDKVDCGSVTPDTGDFTIEFIYQLTGNGGRGGLFERKAGSPYNGFSLGQGGSGHWGFNVSGTSDSSNQLSLTWTYPTLNTWYHDVGVYSGGNSITIYRNGSSVSSTSGTAQGNLSTQGTRTNFLIANRDNINSLPCKVGLVRVYNKALTAAEVLSNYNATKGRFS